VHVDLRPPHVHRAYSQADADENGEHHPQDAEERVAKEDQFSQDDQQRPPPGKKGGGDYGYGNEGAKNREAHQEKQCVHRISPSTACTVVISLTGAR
jgi:hypothetical protein